MNNITATEINVHCRICGAWVTGTPRPELGNVITLTKPHTCGVPGYLPFQIGSTVRVDERVSR